MADRALAAAVATECHDQVVMDAVATQQQNWRNLWAAIESAGHPDDVPEQLWHVALTTENIIAEYMQAAITGCPCPHHIGDTL